MHLHPHFPSCSAVLTALCHYLLSEEMDLAPKLTPIREEKASDQAEGQQVSLLLCSTAKNCKLCRGVEGVLSPGERLVGGRPARSRAGP